MKKYTQLPPVLLFRAITLYLRGCIHFSKEQNGTERLENEDFIIFRKVVVVSPGMKSENPSALFKVYFRFRRFPLSINKTLSLIPIPFIIAQPGFRSKTWLFGKETETFYGLYEWETLEDAEHYWHSFPMKLMKKRAIADSLRYQIINI